MRLTGSMLFLFVASFLVSFYMLWMKSVLSVLFICLAIYSLERILHTTYTVFSNERRLVISNGRFFHPALLPIDDIVLIERRYVSSLSRRFGSYVLVQLANGKCYGITPSGEEEFIKAVNRVLYDENRKDDETDDCED